jgi:hypothetical protein
VSLGRSGSKTGRGEGAKQCKTIEAEKWGRSKTEQAKWPKAIGATEESGRDKAVQDNWDRKIGKEQDRASHRCKPPSCGGGRRLLLSSGRVASLSGAHDSRKSGACSTLQSFKRRCTMMSSIFLPVLSLSGAPSFRIRIGGSLHLGSGAQCCRPSSSPCRPFRVRTTQLSRGLAPPCALSVC